MSRIKTGPQPRSTLPEAGLGNYIEFPRNGLTCPRCQSLDFEAAFERIPGGSNSTLRVASLGAPEELLREVCCNFCQLLSAVRPSAPGPYDLVAFSGHMIDNETLFRAGQGSFPPVQNPVLFAVRPKEEIFGESRKFWEIKTTGFICSPHDAAPSEIRYMGQLLDKRRANFELIHGWLQYCQANHGDLCANVDNITHIPGFKVIDCDQRCIVAPRHLPEYLALSYVWGDDPEHTDPANLAAAAAVPRTIEDAIQATRELGYKYLWVDQYCVSQTEQDKKDAQIRSMGTIYRHAQATIIAAAGTNHSFGLPGVASRARRGQLTASVGPRKFFSIPPDPRVTIPKTRWMGRAWTYQEAMLSRRCIVFTDDQVYFECRAMRCRENFPSPLHTFHLRTGQRFQKNMVKLGLFQLVRVNRGYVYPGDVWHMINEYTRRSLRYDGDALDAFSGVLDNLADGNFSKAPILHFYGVPISPPTRWELGTPRHASGSHAHGFLNALLWDHKVPARRRSGFPSWTWSGWEGEVDGSNPKVPSLSPLYNGCSCDRVSAEIHAESPTGLVLDWTQTWEILVQRTMVRNLFGILNLRARTVPLTFVDGSRVFRAGTPAQNGVYAYSFVGEKEVQNHGTLYNCTFYSKLSLSRQVESILSREIESGPFFGLALGCGDGAEGYRSSGRLLVIDAGNEVAERVGLMDVFRDCWVCGTRSENGKDWITINYKRNFLQEWNLHEEWRTFRVG